MSVATGVSYVGVEVMEKGSMEYKQGASRPEQYSLETVYFKFTRGVDSHKNEHSFCLPH